MRETDFVKQNKDNWSDFEKELEKNDPRPEKITKHYVEIVDDLSFARTHYPNRLVRSYLNGAAENLSIKIHRSRKQNWVNFIKFWKTDLPLIMYESRFQTLLAFLIFMLAVGIGIFSSMHDKEFAAAILGPEYIEQTLRNIKNGDPMAIYKSSDALPMFFQITLNNTFIAARTFLMSFFFGIGTIIILVYNGVMLGVFQYFFIERDLFFESFLAIWQHGVVEISCIILAGGAGLVLAKGIIFPGSYSRLDSFRLAGKKGLIMLLSILPLLVYSGIIESWVTRYTDAHWAFRLSTIVLSVGFVLLYFVIYPFRVAKQTQLKDVLGVVKIPLELSNYNETSVQKNIVIWWESVRNMAKNLKIILLFSTLAGTALYFLSVSWKDAATRNGSYWFLFKENNGFVFTSLFVFTFFGILAAFLLFRKRQNEKNPLTIGKLTSVLFVAAITSLYSSYLFTNGWLFVLWILSIPIFTAVFSVVINEKNTNLDIAIGKSLKQIGISYSKFFELELTSIFAFILLNTMIYYVFDLVINQLLSGIAFPNGTNLVNLMAIVQLFLSSFLIFGFYCSLFLASILAYASISEITTATNLKKDIEKNFPTKEKNVVEKVDLLRKEVFQS